jgi:hypothetical protein
VLPFHQAAWAEVETAAEWYDDQVSGLGQMFLDAFGTEQKRLARFPHVGRLWKHRGMLRDVRRIDLPGFPYAFVYVVEPRTPSSDYLEIFARKQSSPEDGAVVGSNGV